MFRGRRRAACHTGANLLGGAHLLPTRTRDRHRRAAKSASRDRWGTRLPADIHLQPIAEVIRAQARTSARLMTAVDGLLQRLLMIEALPADRCQITVAVLTTVPRPHLLTTEVRLTVPLPRTVADRTAARHRPMVAEAEALTAVQCRLMAAAELLRMAVEAAGLVVAAGLQAVEAEVVQRPATAQAAEAVVLLTEAVETRTAVTDLTL